MDIPSILLNQDLAGSLITLAGQSILVSLIGISIIRLISGKSAPVRSLACSAIILGMGLVVTVSIGLRSSGISWSQTTIPVAGETGKATGPISFFSYEELPPVLMTPLFPAATALSEKMNITRSIPEIVAHSKPFKLPASFFINFLGFIWLAGVLFHLFKLGYGIVLVKNFRSSLQNQNDIPFNEIFRTIAGSFWKNRLPGLYSSPLIDSPITVGLFNPIVIIPEKLIPALSENELKSILLHELAHIYHYDQVIGVLKRVIIAIFWWNPLIYIINRTHEQAREEVSDNYVLSELTPKVYIQCLMTLAEKVCLISNYPTAAGMAGRRFDLKARVEQILSRKRTLAIHTRMYLKAATVSFCMLMTFGIAGLHAHVKMKDLSPSAEEYFEAPAPSDLVVIVEEEQSASKADTIVTEAIEPTISAGLKKTANSTAAEQKQNDTVPKKSDKAVFAMTQARINTEKKIEVRTASATAQPPHDVISKNENSELTKKKTALMKAPEPGNFGSRDISSLKLGVSYLKRGQFDAAIIEFNKAIAFEPRKAVAYTARGSAYFRLDQFDKATADCNKAIEINPDFAAAYQNRGSIYYHQGLFDHALLDYNKAIEIDPDLIASYIDRGNIYQRRDLFDEAISDYSKALELNPGDAETYINRGIAYYSKKQYQEAFIDFDKAIDLDPGSVSAYIYRGYFYKAKKEYGKAVTDYSKALILSPDVNVASELRNEIAQISGKSKLKNDVLNNTRELICRRLAPTGTRFKNKICATKSEWNAANLRGEEIVRTITNRSGNNK